MSTPYISNHSPWLCACRPRTSLTTWPCLNSSAPLGPESALWNKKYMQYNFWETFLDHHSSNAFRDFFSNKFLGRHMSFCGVTDTPVLDFLWCILCWPLGGQYGSWAVLILILANISISNIPRFWWRLWNVVFINAHIHIFFWGGGGLIFQSCLSVHREWTVTRVTTTHWPFPSPSTNRRK